MPINKRESMIFTIIMCAFMVFIMSLYNVGRIHGITSELLTQAWLGFPLAYGIAIVSDWFLVAPLAKKIASKILEENAPTWKKVIMISSSMVSGMVLIMSLFGAIVGVGLSSQTFNVWLMNIPANFIIALPLQMIVAGPIVRFVFRSLFPVGVISN